MRFVDNSINGGQQQRFMKSQETWNYAVTRDRFSSRFPVIPLVVCEWTRFWSNAIKRVSAPLQLFYLDVLAISPSRVWGRSRMEIAWNCRLRMQIRYAGGKRGTFVMKSMTYIQYAYRRYVKLKTFFVGFWRSEGNRVRRVTLWRLIKYKQRLENEAILQTLWIAYDSHGITWIDLWPIIIDAKMKSLLHSYIASVYC